ncbi:MULTISPECIES: transposase [unclassified Bradyrhizobium]
MTEGAESCELSGDEWTAIEPMLPNKRRGVPRANDRGVLNGIFWILRSGRHGADLPNNCGPYTTGPYLHRARNLVWRFVNKIKHSRRVAARCDKRAANCPAFVQLASVRLWLRVNESTS